MTPSRTRLEVRSQHDQKFDPEASTLDAPPPLPWEVQRPPGVEISSCLPAALVDLCCQALDCRHVYIVWNDPQVAALPRFSAAFLFSSFDSVWTPCPKHSKMNDFDLRISIVLGMPLQFPAASSSYHCCCTASIQIIKRCTHNRLHYCCTCSYEKR